MKTRLIVHRAYDKEELVCCAMEVAGRLIGLPAVEPDPGWQTRSAAGWASILFNYSASVPAWKQRARAQYRAHRFERVTLLGETT